MSSESPLPKAAYTAGRPTFLVVDDDPMVRRIVTKGLNQLDPAEVLEVEDGLAAQALLSERQVDVVVTDVVMPNMDGLELMKWAQEHCPGPLWIILSGLETFDAAVDALQLGAFDYLAKPPEVPRVRVAVRNALDQIELVRERERLYAELEQSNAQLADNVEQLQQVCKVLEEQADVIQADLDRAEVIQRALLPQEPPAIEDWCIETLYRPGSSVGGDFYDAVVLDDQHLGLVIADAAGHGVAAAMLSVLFKLRLKQVDRDGRILMPREVLERLNQRLFETLSAPGAFITAAYILLDLRTGKGRLASAGHPPCIHSCGDKPARTLARTGPALGLDKNASYEEHEFQLSPGERLMLYTDGVLEGGPDSPDCDKLAASLDSGGDRAALLGGFYQDAIRGIDDDCDDITMLLLEHTAGTSHFDDAAPAAKRRAPDSASTQTHLLQGRDGNQAFISVVGSVTWLCSQALLDCARDCLTSCERLVVDLGDCEHMDSTCLGTLHEIVATDPEVVVLQRVPAVVHQLFDELSMTRVLQHISDRPRPLPEDLYPVDPVTLNPQQQGARILSAHESLAALSAENRQQFKGVIDSLRSDLQAED